MAKAALISWDPDTNEVTADPFFDDNPIDSAHALKESIADDFPNRLFTVIADEEAKESRSQELMRKIGLE